MKILSNLDLNKNQTLNRVIQQLASAPSTPTKGQEYFDTTLNAPYIHDGTAWIVTDARKATGIPTTALSTDPLARANHTGTQLAATISDFNTSVRTNTLNQMAAPTANIPMAGFTLTGLNTGPSASGQAAEYSWVVSQIQASAAGIDSKPSVNAIAVANQATLTGLVQTVDGVALNTVGMRVLLTAQTTASQNGPWVISAGSWVRPAGETVTPQAFYFVETGTTYSGTQWKVSTTGTIVLDTTSLTLVQFGATVAYTAGNGLQLVGSAFSVLLPASSGLLSTGSGVAIDTSVVARKYAATIGDGSTTSIVVTHNLGTQDVQVTVRDAATNAVVWVDWTATNTTAATINFATAPTTNAYRVTVIG